jgi:hypothetical protein
MEKGTSMVVGVVGNEGRAEPRPLQAVYLDQGRVVHVDGLPFYVMTAHLLGAPENVEAIRATWAKPE